MSATLPFIAGLLAGAAAMLGIASRRRASQDATGHRRRLLLAGGLAAAAVALVGAMSLLVTLGQGASATPGEPAVSASSPPAMSALPAMPPAAGMPSASTMSQILAMPRGARTQMARPMVEAAADLAARLERQGGTAADWNLLAQAYDFLGRPEDAQRARARAAEVGSIQRTR
jgi:hypothetical protein